ncbi:MAG: S46 family peptidase [Prevotellaceae bacterium]|jgi:hypothetical protein|nr:S46 family peptidase [Prevotellaceae bacterium]
MKKYFLLLFSLFLITGIRADEGMWMLPLIEKLNIREMQGLGLTLTAEDIYSDTDTSLKDAVVIFGNGCTGIMVSQQGLVFTNHHCGYDAIQQVSSIEHNYLKNGFAAKDFADEIPCPGLTVTFLVKVEDVTEKVLSQIPPDLTGEERAEKERAVRSNMSKEEELGENMYARVVPFYSGNQYYLFVYETFEDVRLTFTPSDAVGKFGGDTDNWVWPRHTGDFSVFRVYASPDGKPAGYAQENVPYSPKRFAPVSTQGYKEGDFAMIMGYPGSTSRYQTSWGIENRMKTTNQARIDVRGVKQDIWQSYMYADEAVNLAYASKYAGSSNYWKNSIGMNQAIKKLHIIERKKEEEKAFGEWIKKDNSRLNKYKDVLQNLEDGYKKVFPYGRTSGYLSESLLRGVEIPMIAQRVSRMLGNGATVDEVLESTRDFYKDYYPEVDRATFIAMLETYAKYADADAYPATYNTIRTKYKNDYGKYVDYLFDKSVFTSYDKLNAALNNKKFAVEKDPAVIFVNDVDNTYRYIRGDEYTKAAEMIADNERLYEAGLLEMGAEQGKAMYPDANFTLRLTYGTVGGYSPADAAEYDYYSTVKGILEKEDPSNPEFIVPQDVKRAIVNKDFGSYTDDLTGKMHVAFISNNDITGGNSGSPVFNNRGELIGLAFDGNWEAMSGDIVFEPRLQRCINADIRYILFIMDKVGGAERLINELLLK